MATVRITDDLIKGMIARLWTIRRPEEDNLINARPVLSMRCIYDYVMTKDIIKLIENLPSRLRPEPLKTINFQIQSAGHSTVLCDSDMESGFNKKLYPMAYSSWKPEKIGPFNISQNTIQLISGAVCTDDAIKDDYDNMLAFGLAIQKYKTETTTMQRTLRTFMEGQPSLNKALIAMPSMTAFVPPEYKAKLAEVVERKKRAPSEPKAVENTMPVVSNLDTDAFAQLVMTAAGTRV
jgi:hypothetical protein